jgi:hypothetical protein
MRKRTTFGLLALALVAGFFSLRSSQKHEQRPVATPQAQAKPSTMPLAAPRMSRTSATIPAAQRQQPGAPSTSGDVFFARWGGAPGELGRERPLEGNPLGPMSVAVDAKGGVVVLDGVNGRIVRRDANGKLIDSMPIDVRDPQDIAVGRDGSTAVLDRFADKSVAIYDESGKLRGKLPLVGDRITDTGSVTGVFVDGNDVYAEVEHASLIKIGDTSGAALGPQSEIPGRPSRDGLSFLHAGIVDASAGRVFVASIERASENHRFTRELRLGSRVNSIVLLDSDKSGTIYFAADALDVDGTEAVFLSCLDPLSGAPTGGAVLPANTMPEESFRDLVVLDAGALDPPTPPAESRPRSGDCPARSTARTAPFRAGRCPRATRARADPWAANRLQTPPRDSHPRTSSTPSRTRARPTAVVAERPRGARQRSRRRHAAG